MQLTRSRRYSQNADTGFQPDINLGLDTDDYLQPLDKIPPENRVTELDDQPHQPHHGSELPAASPDHRQNAGPADDALAVSTTVTTPLKKT